MAAKAWYGWVFYMQDAKKDIRSMLLEELEEEFVLLGEPKYRAGQVFAWLHKAVGSFEEMTNLSKTLRETLIERFYIAAPTLISHLVSPTDGTVKFLWEFEVGATVETVVMKYAHGYSICVSSQVGCRMGCAFCSSTSGGLLRNLEPSEILAQVLFSEAELGIKVSNVVLMGIGEPLDNFDNVVRFLRLVNHPKGRGIGMRHITLSTCGLSEGIDKLGLLDLQLTLSVSLHAPDDETRSKIMPINRRHGVDEVLRACWDYYRKTGRRVSIEYAMMDGVNDSEVQARNLARIAKELSAHVNLIPLNKVEGSAFEPSKNLKAFARTLEDSGVNVTIRRSLGADVDAACGQLRRRHGIEA